MSKILIVGNHCCSNRGDAAILRGLLDYLEEKYPGNEVVFTSRYEDGAKWFFKEEVLKDSLAEANAKLGGIRGRIKSVLISKIIFPMYCSNKITNKRFLPEAYNEFAKKLSKYDLVIQVGGSFFVDLYGPSQFEAAAICIKENVPIVMLGHSVGPFKINNTSKLAQEIFEKCNALVLREKISEQHLYEVGLTKESFFSGADTAWLINPDKYKEQKEIFNSEKIFCKPCIAITMRELKPFDKRLGITQEDYEQKMASLCVYLIQQGYNVVAASTCTGLESYHRDDRMCALRVARLVNQPSNYFTIMDELTDVELGQLFSKCELTIGTRLHSAILSMRFGTPAFAIYYEHKSLGILEQINMSDCSIPIHDIDSEKFKNEIKNKLLHIDIEVDRVSDNVNREAEHCKKIMNEILDPFLAKSN
ncbi:colanic acid biosynthesis pyruvyl transferase WcaK [Vibrio rumoiensis]|uniref:colanic acid biosynthesis pyruvyl transferase WcaK n=1 Tax=Vibrio rumoiensis TaxID=76258 RepID=UPI0037479EBC